MGWLKIFVSRSHIECEIEEDCLASSPSFISLNHF